ncbi:uncharacterized protein LOC129568312 isoform X1 [Sitodiplosis mosellana]|uniref:uncharacterized protein LOC129568312 isoform X1 n=1 Tax=Sitodiplosis mosellana TaxID=263140 RepID=UPI002444472C|nr:uncharacterized protein LOC129568312 isoform X1 [Sitodiplosis mosellana]
MMEFGELVGPDTRAFWGNYDEFDEENGQLEPNNFSWKWMDEDSSGAENIVSFKNLFIVEGQGIFDFVQTTILKKISPLCQIDGHKTSVYRLSNGDYICVSEDNDLDQSAKMAELLVPWLKRAEQTYVFPFKSAYTYNTQQEFDKRCFIRTISNNNTTTENENEFASMEDCNIVYGLSAGVSTWRHINKLPFTCYTIYMDCQQVDPFVASVALKLFHRLGLDCDASYVLKTVNKSNLYL